MTGTFVVILYYVSFYVVAASQQIEHVTGLDEVHGYRLFYSSYMQENLFSRRMQVFDSLIYSRVDLIATVKETPASHIPLAQPNTDTRPREHRGSFSSKLIAFSA